MKFLKWITALCALLSLLIAGCSGKPTLFIYNWTYYCPDQVLRDFEKEFGVTVVYDTYASNEEMFAKLKAGGTGYDIVFPSEDYVTIMIKEGMLQKLDKSKIPNFSLIDSLVIRKNEYDQGNQFSIPYIMGAAGISVNKKQVPTFEKSWNIYLRTDLKDRMTLLNDMREVLGAALKSLGYSVNSTNPDELEKARQIVMQWKKNIVKFDEESFGKGFASGEFYVVHGYAENVFLELDSSMRPDVEFFIPAEGGPMYVDNMVILKDSKNRALAHQFINYIHRPQVYAQIADFLMVPAINVKSNSYRKIKPNYQLSDLANCEFKMDLGEKLDLYNKIWQEIRVGK